MSIFEKLNGKKMKLSINKVFFFGSVIFFGILSLPSCNSGAVDEKSFEINLISKKWIPDGREGLFNVTAEQQKKGTVVLKGETNIPQAKQEVLDLYKNSVVALIDSIRILPDTVENERFSGIITLSVANLRKFPDHASELISQAILGTPVIVLKNEDSWLLIQTPDRYIAWTEESSVQRMTVVEMQEWRQSERAIYLKISGSIFNSPDESAIVGDIVAGSIIRITGNLNGYLKVLLPDAREGYIRDKELTGFESWKASLDYSGENLCSVAQSFMGSPYLWGGSSTKAVDCSGFVQSVYFQNGRILSRDASLQARHGNVIDISDGFDDLMKGDLLFFGWKNESGPHVTHVAIYIGNYEYIHSTGRVMVNSLDSASNIYNKYRRNSLLSARRILKIEEYPGIIPVGRHEWYQEVSEIK